MIKYKDGINRWRTRSLFLEFKGRNPDDDFEPVFTLYEDDKVIDGIEYKSLYKIYMQYSDPSEYQFAIDTFGSYDNWAAICEASWFKPHLEKWRVEMEAKLRSIGICKMVELAQEGEKTAAKWLAECGFKSKQIKRRAGRPSKEEVKGELKKAAKVSKELKEDMERLGLKVVD